MSEMSPCANVPHGVLILCLVAGFLYKDAVCQHNAGSKRIRFRGACKHHLVGYRILMKITGCGLLNDLQMMPALRRVIFSVLRVSHGTST
jgi:hypothetical protein